MMSPAYISVRVLGERTYLLTTDDDELRMVNRNTNEHGHDNCNSLCTRGTQKFIYPVILK